MMRLHANANAGLFVRRSTALGLLRLQSFLYYLSSLSMQFDKTNERITGGRPVRSEEWRCMRAGDFLSEAAFCSGASPTHFLSDMLRTFCGGGTWFLAPHRASYLNLSGQPFAPP
jgi:hypothetical protein